MGQQAEACQIVERRKKGCADLHLHPWGSCLRPEEIPKPSREDTEVRICLAEGQWGPLRALWLPEGCERGQAVAGRDGAHHRMYQD